MAAQNVSASPEQVVSTHPQQQTWRERAGCEAASMTRDGEAVGAECVRVESYVTAYGGQLDGREVM